MKRLLARILSSKMYFIMMILLFRVLIDISYIYIISPYYAYMGMILDIRLMKVFESYLLLFLFSLLLNHKVNKPSTFFILFLFSLIAIPITSVYALQDQPREYLYLVLLSFLVIMAASNMTAIKIRTLSNGRTLAVGLSVVFGVLLFTWIISRGGLRYLNFNLFMVYDFRRTVAEMVFPGRMVYLMGWFGKVMNPALIAYTIWKRKKTGIIITIGVQILFFGITAHKSILFYPVLIIFVYIFGNKKYLGQMIPTGLAAVTLFSSVNYWITGNLTLVTLFVRRVMFVTALNHFRYYNTFNELGFLYFSGRSWFPNIIEYPFELPVPQVISMIYQGHADTWINTGFLATGYMNFGLAGLLIYSFVVGTILRFIDYIAKHHLPVWMCIAVMITPFFTLLSADLPTVILTHGMGIALIMLWLISAEPSGLKISLRSTAAIESSSAKNGQKSSMINDDTIDIQPKNNICIITTVHPLFDTRIFYKQAKSLLDAGYKVNLIVQHDKKETIQGIDIIPLPRPQNRFQRMLSVNWKAFRLARKTHAGVYHFHDPEFLPWGVLLKWFTRSKIVYDVHEDYPNAIRRKHYLPVVARSLIAWMMKSAESFTVQFFDAIITVTDDIAKRFPERRTIQVRNYPFLDHSPSEKSGITRKKQSNRQQNESIKVVYVGVITEDRGIWGMVRAMEHLPADLDIELNLYGPFRPADLKQQVLKEADSKKITVHGKIDNTIVRAILPEQDIGLVCLLPNGRYETALPVKMFEYMSAGLPIVSSDFPLWKQIVKENQCGLIVDPKSPKEIAGAIEYLAKNPEIRRNMGSNGRQAVQDKYNWQTESRKLAALYESMLE